MTTMAEPRVIEDIFPNERGVHIRLRVTRCAGSVTVRLASEHSEGSWVITDQEACHLHHALGKVLGWATGEVRNEIGRDTP